jgi:peptidoglycan/xylan/chitin deacetylase (PgdA/CDA1 family)
MPQLKKVFFLIFGAIDFMTQSRIFRTEESVLVFHEVENNPCEISIRNGTNTHPTFLTKLLNKIEKKNWMSRLQVVFTFDDGFKLPTEILERLIQLDISLIFFVNVSTVETGLDHQTLSTDLIKSKIGRQNNLSLIDSMNKIYSGISDGNLFDELQKAQGRRLGWSDIDKLKNSGVSIGDHFFIHMELSSFTRESLESLIEESAEYFKRHNITTDYFSLPYGIGTRAETNLIFKSGFKKIYGGSARNVLLSRTNCIPRVQISEKQSSLLNLRGELLLNRCVQKLMRVSTQNP